ncbi:MAG: winged helix-turn-helix transcriptional regulator [Alphaproteobacteria bacterium]|nr:winged helix-turn-helix transcriptional regulator [Alphaproteobacteria bacterium]
MNANLDLLQTTQCLCLASRRAARAITRRFDKALRPHGIRATQFTLLSALKLAGPQPIGELAELIGADRTTLTRNLAVAAEQGLVALCQDEDDARAHIAAITPAGQRAVKKALPAWRLVQQELTEAMGKPAADSLRRVSAGPSLILFAARHD